MKYTLVILCLFLSGCLEERSLRPEYPGYQPSYKQCHNLYDLGYKVDVPKCERDTSNPKYKIGQKLKIKGYDSGCRAIVVGNWSWTSFGNESVYFVKVSCNGTQLIGATEFKESKLFRSLK